MQADDGRVVSNFVVQALREQPITVFGNGDQTRSFCFVDDLVEGLLRLMDTPASYTGPMNLGNPAEFTILQLAELVLAITGSRAPIVFRPLPTDDPRQRQPDIGEAEQVIGWTPQVPLAEGLRRTIDYFDDLLSGRLPPEVVRLAPQRERAESGTEPALARRAAGLAEEEAPFQRRAAPPPAPEDDT
jgi:UDP-glucuronate decarboxylase